MCTNICLTYVIQMDLIRIERVKYTVSGGVVYYTTVRICLIILVTVQ